MDDNLDTALALSNFLTASTGTIMMWYKPTGIAGSGGAECYGGEDLLVSDEVGRYLSLNRNGAFGNTDDRICAWNWDGTLQEIPVAYANDTWTHLAWIHASGVMAFYKDGVEVDGIASGDTESLAQGISICGGGGTGVAAQGTFADVSIEAVDLGVDAIRAVAASRTRRLRTTRPNAYWTLDDCPDGASGNGVIFRDHSGNNRTLEGIDGANNTGLTCVASTHLRYPAGVQ